MARDLKQARLHAKRAQLAHGTSLTTCLRFIKGISISDVVGFIVQSSWELFLVELELLPGLFI